MGKEQPCFNTEQVQKLFDMKSTSRKAPSKYTFFIRTRGSILLKFKNKLKTFSASAE